MQCQVIRCECVCVYELLKFENDSGERFPAKCTAKCRDIFKAILQMALELNCMNICTYTEIWLYIHTLYEFPAD